MRAGIFHVLMRPLRIEHLMVQTKPIIGISVMVPASVICICKLQLFMNMSLEIYTSNINIQEHSCRSDEV